MKILAVSFGAVALVAPGASLAQVTQTYSYDANGRLTGVVTTGGAGTHTSAYAYDAANNRTSRSQTGTSAWAAVTLLPINQLLQPDEALVSPDGRYSFALRATGRLELWSGEAAVTSDAEPLVAAFRLTDDGQAQFLPSIPAAPAGGAWVSLRDDGVLALLDEAGDELWRSGDATGEEASQ
ncbi:RHS repeat domain-containing protein [Brevundimonas sp.]|uniref:RHS repeat domain-containing protein n=1 Tax=Brevundimonas sp. TaxID=1871086 RepID=UPI002EDB2B89